MSGLHLRAAVCFHLKPVGKRVARHSISRGARLYATQKSGLDVSHSQFLAEASPKAKWGEEVSGRSKKLKSKRRESRQDELDGVTDSRGKLSPTSSHLFKLVLPLGNLSHPSNTRKRPQGTNPNRSSTSKSKKIPPTIILLHPSQPLSHVSHLILASLAPATPTISFRSKSSNGKVFQWSDSTDLGDFIRDAARAAEFTICMSYGPESARRNVLPAADQRDGRTTSVDPVKKSESGSDSEVRETFLTVSVPTFADRTRFLRRRLIFIEGRLHDMEGLKAKCDEEAHRGARKMALGGFAMLVVYWGAVARLTDIMEPITYLSGLSTVILGYLWFLYQGREVSYTSILARSVSARREALYKTRGLDIERWMELVSERKAIRAEIGRIARDYEGDDDDDTALDDEEFSQDDDDDGDGMVTSRKHVMDEVTEEDESRRKAGTVTNGKEGRDILSVLDEEDESSDVDEKKEKKEARKANFAGL
ncbi:hypothetical protein BDZ97DRAFT_2076718 [Flammula alnicola]|nr:hypothetical protein BDZ97DRAFT_2076718 [Flammula alnicola]